MNKELQSTLMQFGGKLLIFLFPSYWLQLYIYSYFSIAVDSYILQLSYFINGLLAIFIFTVLMLLKKKYNDQLGFLYMLGSFVKFGAFFLVFHPIFKEDNIITKIEFGVFFVPYLISLLIETIDLIKILNSNEIKEE